MPSPAHSSTRTLLGGVGLDARRHFVPLYGVRRLVGAVLSVVSPPPPYSGCVVINRVCRELAWLAPVLISVQILAVLSTAQVDRPPHAHHITARIRRQTFPNYNSNFNFQNFSNANSFFPPQPDLSSAFRQQFQSINTGNSDQGFNTIRRFPQFPSSS
ncbi:unnamed protein product, partial [Oppiella nova]